MNSIWMNVFEFLLLIIFFSSTLGSNVYTQTHQLVIVIYTWIREEKTTELGMWIIPLLYLLVTKCQLYHNILYELFVFILFESQNEFLPFPWLKYSHSDEI